MIGNPSVWKGHEKQLEHLGLWFGNEPFRSQFFSKTDPRRTNPFGTILQLTLSFVCPLFLQQFHDGAKTFFAWFWNMIGNPSVLKGHGHCVVGVEARN